MNHLHRLRRQVGMLLGSAFILLCSGSATAAASMSLAQSNWSRSAQVTINWTGSGLASGAWIGAYAAGSADTAYINSVSISGTGGVVSFGLLSSGNYEARLFADGGYSQKQATISFSVANPTGSLSLSSSAVKVGNSVTVNWQSQPGITTSGWIGVYTPGAADNAYVVSIPYQYVAGGTSGSLTFTAPNTIGSYEFRLFADYDFSVKIATASFTVANPVASLAAGSSSYASGDTVTLNWSADASLPSGAWVGIYAPGSSDRSALTYKQISGASGSVTFSGLAVGSYESRLFGDSGYDRKLASTTFAVGAATTSTTSTTSTTTTSTTTTTLVRDTSAPTVPTGLVATASSATQIDLSWSSSIDDVGVTAYKIYRNGTQVETRTVTTWSNTGLSPSTTYAFTVVACDAAGNCSAQSSSASATTAQSTSGSATAKSDCLFNWAESNYAALFSPKGSSSITFGPYYLRFYSATNAYLAVSGSSLVYLGPLSGNQLLDLGSVTTWYANAGCN